MNDEELEKIQSDTLKNLLLKIEQKYLTDKNICRILLQGSQQQKRYLNLIDITHRNLTSSMHFKQYRRAQRFLITLDMLCRKCFNY